MPTYQNRYAQLYDIFYEDKQYDLESAFIHECLSKFGTSPPKTILELACGTGGHAMALEKHGYQIDATDISSDMLDLAIAKVGGSKSSIEFRLQDMRHLSRPIKSYDGVICLFDSIGYVQSNEAVLQVLEGVNCQLAEGGLFIFDFWHAAAMLTLYDPVRIRRWRVDDMDVIRISETKLDIQNQIGEVKYTIYELHSDGTFQEYCEVHKNRFFLEQEMATLLSRSNFKPLMWFAGYVPDEEITENTWHILVVAKKITAV